MTDHNLSPDISYPSYEFSFTCENPFDEKDEKPAQVHFLPATVTVALQSRYHAKKFSICEVEDLRLVGVRNKKNFSYSISIIR